MKKDIQSLFDEQNILDPKSAESLSSAIKAGSLQGFDYLKFKTSYHTLIKMGQDESMALRSAYTTAATLGITKEKLITTAKHYAQILFREKQQFDHALKKQLQQRVDSKLNETEFFKEKIKDYKTKIKELQSEISVLEKKIKSADAEINTSKDKIVTTRDKFESTYNHFITTIENDIGLIEKYL